MGKKLEVAKKGYSYVLVMGMDTINSLPQHSYKLCEYEKTES